MIRYLVVAAVLALAGCSTAPRVPVFTPVPVECREAVPDRPAMPTESLGIDVEPFVLFRSALAEIDVREGYEVRMRAALEACTRPIEGGASGSP